MVNNFQAIKPLLNFDSDDDFYHLQIIKRRKENPDMKSNSYALRSYYITSINYLEEIMKDVVAMCHMQTARACLNLNRRSFEKVAMQVMLKVTNQIINKDFKSVRRVYESVCGGCSNEPKKRWIIDIDTFDEDYISLVKSAIHLAAQRQQDEIIDINTLILATLPTKNGFHIITTPFPMLDFSKKFPGVDIHKDNPTLLYAIN